MALVQSDTVRGEYTSGTGWEAGNKAPATRWVDEDGNVSETEPKGVSRVLVAAGDVVRPHMVDVLNGGSLPVRGDVSNDNSPGDASRMQTPAPAVEPVVDPYDGKTKKELSDLIADRNVDREDDEQIVADKRANVAALKALLLADDAKG